MSAPNLTRWIGIGLLGLPLSGLLTFWSSLSPQPDPSLRYEDWARFVTTEAYVLSHVLGSGLGLIASIFGIFALGAWLSRSPAGRMGLIAMSLAVLGASIFLMLMGVSAFAAPEEGQAHLAGVEGLRDLPTSFSDRVFGVLTLLMIALTLIGNLLMGVAVWRSGVLPRWTGALWGAAPVLMYVLGLAAAMLTGSQSTPPTVPLGALVMVVGGAGMAWSVLRGGTPRNGAAPAG